MFRVDDQTELCWVLETAQMIVEADLTDAQKRIAIYARNESDGKSKYRLLP